MEGGMNWADEVDEETTPSVNPQQQKAPVESAAADDEELPSGDELPPRTESAPDANGICTIVEWFINNDGKRVKRTVRVKRKRTVSRVNKHVEERKGWEKFGEQNVSRSAKQSVTTVSTEEISVEKPRLRGEVEEKKESAADKICNFSNFFARLEARKRGELPDNEPGSGKGGEDAPLKSGGAGRYVPPSLRAGAGDSARQGASMNSRDDSSTLRVTNLPEDANEDDLRMIFSRFGSLQRVYVAKDKRTGESRQFAFINFYSRNDAERALEKVNGYGMDNLILAVDWSNPPNKDRP